MGFFKKKHEAKLEREKKFKTFEVYMWEEVRHVQTIIAETPEEAQSIAIGRDAWQEVHQGGECQIDVVECERE